jgi:hypothetical protein
MNQVAHNSGKSPYQRGHSAARSRGKLLVATVVVLLIAAGAWIVAYTRAVERTPIGGSQLIDPGAAAQSASRVNGPGVSSGH